MTSNFGSVLCNDLSSSRWEFYIFLRFSAFFQIFKFNQMLPKQLKDSQRHQRQPKQVELFLQRRVLLFLNSIQLDLRQYLAIGNLSTLDTEHWLETWSWFTWLSNKQTNLAQYWTWVQVVYLPFVLKVVTPWTKTETGLHRFKDHKRPDWTDENWSYAVLCSLRQLWDQLLTSLDWSLLIINVTSKEDTIWIWMLDYKIKCIQIPIEVQLLIPSYTVNVLGDQFLKVHNFLHLWSFQVAIS